MNNIGKIIVTKLNNMLLLFLFNSEHELISLKVLSDSLVDSIYIGRVDSINEGLSCAFVNISKEQKVFLPINNSDNIKCGDNVLVQIKTDALKTKLPQGDLDICIPGEYCVVHANNCGISASKKLSKDIQIKLIDLVKNSQIENIDKYGIVIRTNAAYLLDDDYNPLLNEIKTSILLLEDILSKANSRVVYTKLHQNSNSVCQIISDFDFSLFDTIITDLPEVYDSLINLQLLSKKNIRLYEDNAVSLVNLYSLKTHLGRVLDKKVYLDCGGYLIIEPTEAMTVIDVNSGKCESKKRKLDQFIYTVNEEAAYEVARQISLRNISGIIMVDFINMTNKEDENKILNILKNELSKDKVKTTLVDITPLGIVEITRRKVSLPIDKSISI